MKLKTKAFFLFLLMAGFANAFGGDGEIKKVDAEGRGATRAEAIEAAYRNAIQQEVGVILKERNELDDENLKTRILTLSNGYVVEPPPESAIVETKTEDGVHVKITGLKIYAEKMKKRMLELHQGAYQFDAIQKDPEKFGYRALADAYARMLIDELDDYVKLFQVIPVDRKIVPNRRGEPSLAVNFRLCVNPSDYRNYLDSLTANLAKMNFAPIRGGDRTGKCLVSFRAIPSDRRAETFGVDVLNVDRNALQEHYYQNGKCRVLICRMTVLDKNGDALQTRRFVLSPRSLFLSWPVLCNLRRGVSIDLEMPGSRRSELSRDMHATFDFADPDDAAKAESVSVALIWDFPDASVESLTQKEARGFCK